MGSKPQPRGKEETAASSAVANGDRNDTIEKYLTRRFLAVVSSRIDFIERRNRSDDAATTTSVPLLGREEIKTFIVGPLEGVASGILSFILLRRIRASLFKRFSQTTNPVITSLETAGRTKPRSPEYPNMSPFQQKSTPSKSSNTATGDMNGSISSRIKADFPEAASRRKGGMGRVLVSTVSWMFDATLSLCIAGYVGTRGQTPSELLNQVVDLPSKQSRLAHELCPDLVAELKSLKDDVQRGDTFGETTARDVSLALENPQDPSLQAILRFCRNCQQRAAYETLLRQQQGLEPDDPVSIPPTGIPADFECSVDSLVADRKD